MRKFDLLYKNSGRAAATKTQQIAFDIARSNARDSTSGSVPPLMSTEGAALAKRTAPGSAFDIPYLDDRRERFAVSDTETEAWRRFKPGDDPGAIVSDPLSALIAEQSDESEPEETEEEFDELLEDEGSEIEENGELSRTGNAFDRARLLRAVDRLTRRTKKRLAKGHDGRSYGRDNRGDRSYAVCTGMIGGLNEWNEAYRRGEVV
jgi:hypothetical protein